MRKFFLLAIVLLGLMIAPSACTEETITPVDQHDGGGGTGSDPKG